MIETIKIKSLDDLFNNHCEGHRPKKPLDHSGRFTENNRFGKGRRFGISTTDGKGGILQDHKAGKTLRWILSDYIFKEKPKKKPKKNPEDVTEEFNRFPIAKSHPYLKAKGVSIFNLELRKDRGNLIIPFYTLEGHFISGWQAIWSKPQDDGAWPKTTRKGSSNKKHLPSYRRKNRRAYLYLRGACDRFKCS